MGNASCFGRRRRSKAAMVVVHPLDQSRRGGDEEGGGVRRLKVRMTSGQLKELIAELKKKKQDSSGKGLSSDDSELGRLVFRECLKGSLHARLVSLTSHDGSHQSTVFSGANISLSTIQERSDDDDDEDHHDH
ncbi:hypothetical protein QN277_023915 [Acacia crassicarpa]|uniref:Uncharacterized protein n=1 Tax=Acacia crassicarpa TaxID=499986 RepID=A0AAE1K6Q1_9FABA|nr:hypothetical protein QN277_023915 [Acacia crassicarpa]